MERAIRFFERLSPAGKIALVAGALIAFVALLTVVTAIVGEESGSSRSTNGSSIQTVDQQALRGGCTLAREDGTLEQITLTGKPVSAGFCQAFASFLEENAGVEEHTWIARAPARPIARADCSSCNVAPACRANIAGAGAPDEPVLFVVEAEEAFDELHYDTVYAHNVCELVNGRTEIQRFIDHYRAG